MKRLLIVTCLFLGGCASIQPSVKAVCAVCSTVCPFVGALRSAPVACADKQRAVIANWPEVEKGAEPVVVCK